MRFVAPPPPWRKILDTSLAGILLLIDRSLMRISDYPKLSFFFIK